MESVTYLFYLYILFWNILSFLLQYIPYFFVFSLLLSYPLSGNWSVSSDSTSEVLDIFYNLYTQSQPTVIVLLINFYI